MLMYQSLNLPLLLRTLCIGHDLCNFVESSVSRIDVTQHQLNVAHSRPDISIIAPLFQEPTEPPQGKFVFFTPGMQQAVIHSSRV